MAKKDEWIPWALGGLAIAGVLGYMYITSQKAGAPPLPMQGQQQGIAVGEPNPSAPKEEGCGCEAEPQSQADVAGVAPPSSVVGTPGT